MIGYKMGFSLARVYTTAKAFPMDIFKDNRRNDMVVNMAIPFTREVRGQVSCPPYHMLPQITLSWVENHD